jgi:subtilisin-like proprotein convertase family protein
MAKASAGKVKETDANETYTYRAGEKVALKKRPDQFVVRRLPSDLPVGGEVQQVSSGSTRITCAAAELEELMERSRATAVAHHAYEAAETGEEFLITDRIIVSFAKSLTPEEVGAFAGQYGLEILSRYSETKYLFRLTAATGMNPVKLVVKLMEAEPRVARAEHDLNMRFRTAVELPGDPNYADQWHLHQRRQHPEFDPRASSRCEAAWTLLGGFGSADVVVGVTDDGCKLDHHDFDSATKFAGWGYFEGEHLYRQGDPGSRPERMYISGSNHGTSCAGVIAAEVDAAMTVGAAPGCRLLPIRWQSEGPSLFISDSKLLTVLDYVGSRVDILSNSWGISPRSRWSQDVLERIEALALSGGRRGKGILFLWAAGNENCPIDHVSSQPVPYTSGWEFRNGSWVWVGVDTATVFSHDLVGIPGVMHVAALASTAQRSHYSNYGRGIDLCASSSNSHAYSRLFLAGLGVTTTTGATGGVDHSFGGTSSATPLVAGIAALVLSANPQLSALEVASILRRTAAKDLNLAGYPRTPPSSEDQNPTWDISPVAPFDQGEFTAIGSADGTWSPWFGHGKADALAAVRAALDVSVEHTTRVRIELTPNLEIPDRDPAGIVSRVFVPDPGLIRSLRVHVDIQHTYIGDLIVRLVGPDGTRADLHRRAGGGADDISLSYDDRSVPALAAFLGTDIRGTWGLEVSDHVRSDTGRLRRWSLEAEVLADTARQFESAPGRAIPDQEPLGIQDRIAVAGVGTVSTIAVDVDITHTWIGDLRIVLADPTGREVILHAREGQAADDIQRRYTIEDEPDLRGFIGQPADGEWVLSVSDHARRDVGKLNRWALLL